MACWFKMAPEPLFLVHRREDRAWERTNWALSVVDRPSAGNLRRVLNLGDAVTEGALTSALWWAGFQPAPNAPGYARGRLTGEVRVWRRPVEPPPTYLNPPGAALNPAVNPPAVPHSVWNTIRVKRQRFH